MKIPEKIVKARLQKEVAIYEEEILHYEESKSAMYEEEEEYECDGSNCDRFISAIKENAKYFNRIEQLQNTLTSLLDELDILKQEAPLLDTKTLFQVKVAKEEEAAAQPQICYNEQEYDTKQFRKVLINKLVKEEKENELLEVQNPKNTKIQYPQIVQKARSTAKSQEKETRLFKQQYKEAIISGEEFLDNIYKDRREEAEEERLRKFVQEYEKELQISKKEAEMYAIEITKRDLQYFEEIQHEKEQKKKIELLFAENKIAERKIAEYSSLPEKEIIAEEYLPENLEQPISQKADNVVPANFGLGYCKATKFLPGLEEEAKIEAAQNSSIAELLGVENQALVFESAQDKKRPPSRTDKKKTGKQSSLSNPPAEASESSDDLPVVEKVPLQHTIARNQRPLPVIKNSPRVDSFAQGTTTTSGLAKIPQPLLKQSSFIASPEELNYYNFEINQPLECTLRVTNSSTGLAAFKLLDIEEQYKNMFVIKYQPGGMLAPGNGVDIKVQFTYNDINIYSVRNIKTVLRIKHQQGILEVPIRCFHQQFQIQAFSSMEESYLQYSRLLEDQKCNFNIDECEVEKRTVVSKSGCLLFGKRDFGYYIINTGNVRASAIFTNERAGAPGNMAPLLKNTEISQAESLRADYLERKEDMSKNIAAEFQEYKLQQEAENEKRKLKTDKTSVVVSENFEGVTDDTFEGYLEQRIREKIGEVPPETDELLVKFKQQIGFGEQLVKICEPQCLYMNEAKFDEAKYRDAKLGAQKALVTEQVLQEVEEEIRERREKQLNTLDKRKQPIIPPLGEINFMTEEGCQQYRSEQTEARIASEMQNYSAQFSVSRDLLHFELLDDVSYKFVIPEQTLIHIPFVHQPKELLFREFGIEHTIRIINGKSEVLRSYMLESQISTFSSPIQLEEEVIDFETCFYNQEYNSLFKVILLNEESSEQFGNLSTADPASLSRKIHFEIPSALLKYVKIDENDMILNYKNAYTSPKISITVPDKRSLHEISRAPEDDWGQVSVQFNQLAASTAELGSDIDELVSATQRCEHEAQEAAGEALALQKQRDEVREQVVQLQELKAQVGSSNGKMKMPKNAADEDALLEQLAALDRGICQSSANAEELRGEIQALQARVQTEDFVGAYNTLAFRLRITAYNQPETLFLACRARFTTCGLRARFLESGRRDLRLLGKCVPGWFYQVPVAVRNESALPQHVLAAFERTQSTNLDFKTYCEPYGGLALLQPGQSITFNACFSLATVKAVHAKIEVTGEFGEATALFLSAESASAAYSVILKDRSLQRLAVNDTSVESVILRNNQPQAIKWQVAPSFLRELEDLDGFCEILPSSGILAASEAELQLKIDAQRAKLDKVRRFVAGQPTSNIEYLQQYIPEAGGELFLDLRIPLSTDHGMQFISLRLIIIQPLVYFERAQGQGEQSQAEEEVPEYNNAIGKGNAKKPKAGSQKQPNAQEPAPSVEVVDPDPNSSLAILDFGKSPVGQAVKKQLKISSDEEFYIKESSIEYYDAELTMLSYINGQRIEKSKTLTFEYLPNKQEKTQETILLCCYKDREFTEKINNLQILLRGEAIAVQLDVKVEGINNVESLNIDNEITGCLPILELHERAIVKIVANSELDNEFLATIRQVEHKEDISVHIEGQSMFFGSTKQETSIIEIEATAYHSKGLNNLQLVVESGDFKKKVNVFYAIQCGEVDLLNTKLQIVNDKIVDVAEAPIKKGK